MVEMNAEDDTAHENRAHEVKLESHSPRIPMVVLSKREASKVKWAWMKITLSYIRN